MACVVRLGSPKMKMFEWSTQRTTTHRCSKRSKMLRRRRIYSRLPSYSSLPFYRKSFWYSPLRSNLSAKQNASFQFLSQSLEVWCSPYCELIVFPDEKQSAISGTDEVHISFRVLIEVSLYTCKDELVVPW